MLIDQEWLRRKIATDPDMDCEAMTPPPEPTDLEALSGLLEKATQGPWTVWSSGKHFLRDATTNGWGILTALHRSEVEADANAALIVAAINALPNLIAELKATRTALAAKDVRIAFLEELSGTRAGVISAKDREIAAKTTAIAACERGEVGLMLIESVDQNAALKARIDLARSEMDKAARCENGGKIAEHLKRARAALQP